MIDFINPLDLIIVIILLIIASIGAYIGFFTLLLGKIVNETGLVYSFEPELNNFRLFFCGIYSVNIYL